MKEADTLREEVEKLRAKVGELEGQVKDGEAATKKAEAAAEAAKAKADAMTQAAGEFLLVWGAAAAAASGRRALARVRVRELSRHTFCCVVLFLLLLLFCFAVLFWPADFFLPIWLVGWLYVVYLRVCCCKFRRKRLLAGRYNAARMDAPLFCVV